MMPSAGTRRSKGEVLEDVKFARRIKAARLRLRMADGNRLIACRMYSDWPSVRDGYAKNILAGYGVARRAGVGDGFSLAGVSVAVGVAGRWKLDDGCWKLEAGSWRLALDAAGLAGVAAGPGRLSGLACAR